MKTYKLFTEGLEKWKDVKNLSDDQLVDLIKNDNIEIDLPVSSHLGEALEELEKSLINIDLETDGISQLLCQLMGGQLDINVIEKCILKDFEIPQKTESVAKFLPKTNCQFTKFCLKILII